MSREHFEGFEADVLAALSRIADAQEAQVASGNRAAEAYATYAELQAKTVEWEAAHDLIHKKIDDQMTRHFSQHGPTPLKDARIS